MYIFIEAVTGLTIRIQIHEYEYIKSIKHRIMMSEDIPIDDQELVYHDQVLSNNLRLMDYEIGNGSVLKLILKMRGGPLSPELIYDEESSMSFFPNSDSDKILFLYVENGNLNMIPMPSLDVQQHHKNEFNLADQQIYSRPSSDQTKELNDQNFKLTTLRLKMDKIRLSKRISSMYGNNNTNHSTIPSSNTANSVNTSCESNAAVNLKNNLKPILSVNTNPNHPNPQKPSLQRSISLDSRSVGYIQSQSENAASRSSKVLQSPDSHRSPKLGLHRTMSFLDTLKLNRMSPKFPHLNDLQRKRTALSQYMVSFNLPTEKSSGSTLRDHKDKSITVINDNQISSTSLTHRPGFLPILNESEFEVRPKKLRCSVCNKKLTMTIEFTCRCNKKFCPKHRYPEEHSCSFDFKSQGRVTILKDNPMIEAEKLSKI